jgi:RND family efflux transporter MFP subunit
VARSYSLLTAPFDWVVAERLVDPGSLAAPGAPLLVVEASGPPRLEVRVDESRAVTLAPGAAALVRLDSDSSPAWLPATAVEIARADPSSHSVLVKLQLPATVDARSGSFGRARFSGAGRRTLTVPSSSLVRRAGLTFVDTVQDSKEARLRPVNSGAVDGERSEILAGVAEGDLVVVDPPPELMDGSPVRIAPTPGAASPEGAAEP